jgi:flagellar hook-basal body complex protein FliE
MTSPISAISGISGIGGVDALQGVQGLQGLDGLAATSGTGATSGANSDFTSMLAKGLESVQASQTNADSLATQVADGSLKDPAQYTMAATEASLGMELTLAIRNKAMEAFQEIMRMQA